LGHFNNERVMKVNGERVQLIISVMV